MKRRRGTLPQLFAAHEPSRDGCPQNAWKMFYDITRRSGTAVVSFKRRARLGFCHVSKTSVYRDCTAVQSAKHCDIVHDFPRSYVRASCGIEAKKPALLPDRTCHIWMTPFSEKCSLGFLAIHMFPCTISASCVEILWNIWCSSNTSSLSSKSLQFFEILKNVSRTFCLKSAEVIANVKRRKNISSIKFSKLAVNFAKNKTDFFKTSNTYTGTRILFLKNETFNYLLFTCKYRC